MNFISIVTIGYANLDEIKKTCESVDSQTFLDYEHIIVASNIDCQTADISPLFGASAKRIIVLDQDSGIYSAMNIGISRSTGRYILFMNSGDTFSSKHSLALVFNQVSSLGTGQFRCFAFAGYQVYLDDYYFRVPVCHSTTHTYSAPHQSFIAPNSQSSGSSAIYFDESLSISADSNWINENIKLYGCKFSFAPISVMSLGGVSNKPSLRYVYIQLASGKIMRSARGFLKLLFSMFVSRRLYYRIISRLNAAQVYIQDRSLYDNCFPVKPLVQLTDSDVI